MCRDDETGLWVARSFGSVRVNCLSRYIPTIIDSGVSENGESYC